MKTLQWSQGIIVGVLLIVVGCAQVTPPVSQEIPSKSITLSFPQQIKDLAGPWEYKDSAGHGIITLNAEGDGAYEWEEGRFETHSLTNGVWTGVWIQKGNDREGGFELTFSDDASVAQGEWWYTRIEKDKDPLEPGGPFSMTRSLRVKIPQ